MKKIIENRVVEDVFYVAEDGEKFKTSNECIKHEQKINFSKYVVNTDNLDKGLSDETYMDYMYTFLHKFYEYPEKYAQYLFREEGLRTFFIYKISQIFNLFTYLNSDHLYEYEKDGYFRSKRLLSNLTRLYREGIELYDFFDFIFNKMKIKLDDIVELYNERPDFIERERKFDKKEYFYICYSEDSIESMDLLLENGYNLEDFLNHGHSKETYDFITNISFYRHYKNVELSEDSRLRWIKYILEKVPSYRFYQESTRVLSKYYPGNMEYELDNSVRKYITKSEAIHFINSESAVNVNVKAFIDVISTYAPDYELDRSDRYKFVTNTLDKISKILKRGSKLFNYEISKECLEIVLSVDNTDYILAKFMLDVIPRGATGSPPDDYVVFYYVRRENTKKQMAYSYTRKKMIVISEYINNPDLFQEKILYYLNDSKEFSLDKLNKAQEITNKIQETEDYLRALKEERDKIWK